MKGICQNCDNDDIIENHHVVPGGNLVVQLCYVCHQKAHGLNGVGQPLGRPNKIQDWIRALALEIRKDDVPLDVIADIFNEEGLPPNGSKWSSSSFDKWINDSRDITYANKGLSRRNGKLVNA